MGDPPGLRDHSLAIVNRTKNIIGRDLYNQVQSFLRPFENTAFCGLFIYAGFHRKTNTTDVYDDL